MRELPGTLRIPRYALFQLYGTSQGLRKLSLGHGKQTVPVSAVMRNPTMRERSLRADYLTGVNNPSAYIQDPLQWGQLQLAPPPRAPKTGVIRRCATREPPSPFVTNIGIVFRKMVPPSDWSPPRITSYHLSDC